METIEGTEMPKKLSKKEAGEPAPETKSKPVDELNFCANKKARLYAKIMQSRNEILDCLMGKKKSGKNSFQKFEYFETKDFLPQLMKILESHRLYSVVDFNEGDISRLKIFDLETGEYTFASDCPTAERAKGNPNQQMQSIMALYTYTERYLYMKAFSIVENDTIDAESGKPQKNNSKPVKFMTVNEVNKHMQGLPNPKDFDEAEKELNKLKIENKITQKTYEIVFNNIEMARGKQH